MRILAVFILSVLSAVPALADGKSRPAVPLPYVPSDDATPVDIEFAGTRMRIPRNYFRYPPENGGGKQEGGVLLRVLLPDLKPYTRETAWELDGRLGWGDRLQIMISDKNKGNSLEYAYNFSLKSCNGDVSEKNGVVGCYHDKTHYFEATLDGDRVVRQGVCSFGLASPMCFHFFNFGVFRIRITYSYSHKSNHIEIEQRAVQLISTFINNAATLQTDRGGDE